jgi:hypothetical protein
VGRSFEGQHGAFSVSFEIIAENPDYLMVYVDGNDVMHGPNIYFVPSRYLAYCDDCGWHYLCSSSADVWYKIRMVIDIPTNAYDICINEALSAQEAHFRFRTGNPHKRHQLWRKLLVNTYWIHQSSMHRDNTAHNPTYDLHNPSRQPRLFNAGRRQHQNRRPSE